MESDCISPVHMYYYICHYICSYLYYAGSTEEPLFTCAPCNSLDYTSRSMWKQGTSHMLKKMTWHTTYNKMSIIILNAYGQYQLKQGTFACHTFHLVGMHSQDTCVSLASFLIALSFFHGPVGLLLCFPPKQVRHQLLLTPTPYTHTGTTIGSTLRPIGYLHKACLPAQWDLSQSNCQIRYSLAG